MEYNPHSINHNGETEDIAAGHHQHPLPQTNNLNAAEESSGQNAGPLLLQTGRKGKVFLQLALMAVVVAILVAIFFRNVVFVGE